MPILLVLLTLFIGIPLVELTLLLMLADLADHWGWAVAAVVVTGVVGTALARSQGVRVLADIRERLAAGEVPGAPLFDAVLIFIAGALLITPGLLTDALGFSLLIPFCRRFYRNFLIKRFKARLHIQEFSQAANGARSAGGWFFGDNSASEPPSQGSGTIDSYVVREDGIDAEQSDKHRNDE